MEKKALLRSIVEVADYLDAQGLHKEADVMDGIMRKVAQERDMDLEYLDNEQTMVSPPVGMVDWLKQQGYTPQQIPQLLANPSMINKFKSLPGAAQFVSKLQTENRMHNQPGYIIPGSQNKNNLGYIGQLGDIPNLGNLVE